MIQNGMKYRGEVGFIINEETEPGIWKPYSMVQEVRGEVIQNTVSWNEGDTINSDVKFQNRISIVLSNFLTQNMMALRWITYMGVRFKISKIELKPPRMIFTLGDEYIEEGDYDRAQSGQSSFGSSSEGVCN